ncbi:hypothetical protein NSS98_30810 [Paenibacillus sp. FSL E2-0274]|uniref:hypothetical protein n=1 Tax=Paenibacillus TaxID=44249 RepID=UPI00096DA354|nr:hypothetical protein [Paenibacillus odorifer]OMD12611.1 hypothetical protein BJP47_05165 [Paenibacillus odorifer]OME36241.1 hypothetical protein BSK63_03830 [Paenibacillus odorifer]
MAILLFDQVKNKLDMFKAEAAVKRAEKQDHKRFREEKTYAAREITVHSKAELNDAVSKQYGTIIVTGNLATQVNLAYKVKHKVAQLDKLPKGATPAILGVVGITETVIVTAIVALTLVLVLALFKNYQLDADFQVVDELGEMNPKLRLKLVK